MTLRHKTYYLQLDPSDGQKILLDRHFGCVRWVYNYFLSKLIEQYKAEKKKDSYIKQCEFLVWLKKQPEFIWLNQVNSQALQAALRFLDVAYKNMFLHKKGHPKHKSKRGKNNFHVPQNVKVKNNKLYICKFREGIKIRGNKQIVGNIKSCTVSKSATGKYFVSILVEKEIKTLPKTGKQIGIDLGLKNFIITSENVTYENNRYTKQYERKLASSQKHLSRKKKLSKSYENQRRKVAKVHEKIRNSRKDFLHKASRKLVEENDLICVETLGVKNMVKNKRLSKAISDVSWGTFLNFLSYKAEWYGKEVIKVDKFFASSKICHHCGHKNENLKLHMREWECQNCGNHNDRDLNAAKNILKEGIRIKNTKDKALVSVGTIEYTGGDSNKTFFGKHKSVKPENLMLN
jgi:putative transposase